MKTALSMLWPLALIAALDAPAASGVAEPIFAQPRTGAKPATLLEKSRDVVNVREFGARGDNATNDAAAIQAAINALGASGGVVYLPKGAYFIGAIALTITSNSTQLVGAGGDFDETSATDAPTMIRYTGTGSAISVGSARMTAVLHGIVIRDLEVRGTPGAVAGIHFHYNNPASAFVARSLVENVSVQGFTGAAAAGIRFDFGVSNTLRRTNTFLNTSGIRIDAGTAYHLDGVISRINTGQGVHVKFANGLLIDGMSVLESNDGSGFYLEGIDHSRNIYVIDNHFEDNNKSGSTGYQLHISGRGAVRASNVVIARNEFAGSRLTAQNGDILVDFVSSAHIDQVWTNRTAAAPVLRIGSTAARVRYGRQIVLPAGSAATIDPDNRGMPEAQSGVFTATVSGPVSASVPAAFARHDKVVTLTMPGAIGAGARASLPISITGLPSYLRPASTFSCACLAVRNNGADSSAPGMLHLTDSGVMTVYRDTGFSSFAASAAATGFHGWSVSYLVR
jgi:hypothetical protein